MKKINFTINMDFHVLSRSIATFYYSKEDSCMMLMPESY